MPGRVEAFCEEPLRLLPKTQKIVFVSGSTAGCSHGVAPLRWATGKPPQVSSPRSPGCCGTPQKLLSSVPSVASTMRPEPVVPSLVPMYMRLS